MRTGSSATISSLEKAFRIVNVLEREGPQSLTELTKELDLSKSTIYTYLNTLERENCVVHTEDGYRLGMAFLHRGAIARRQLGVFQAAKLEVDKVANETRETTGLSVEQNGKRVLVYISEVDSSIFDNAATGEFTHMHWTASGKALLAWRSDDQIREIVERHGLPEGTSKTIIDIDDLFGDIEVIRERGYAIGDEERREGIFTIGVPILDLDTDRPVAALSVSGPKERIGADSVRDEIVSICKEYSNIIQLRYNHYK